METEYIEKQAAIDEVKEWYDLYFEAHNDVYNEPPVVWNTYNQVMRWLHVHVVVNKEYVILDEYDDVVSFDNFKEIVEEKQKEENPDIFSYSRNVDGYRFTDGEFS